LLSVTCFSPACMLSNEKFAAILPFVLLCRMHLFLYLLSGFSFTIHSQCCDKAITSCVIFWFLFPGICGVSWTCYKTCFIIYIKGRTFSFFFFGM
jgi:hypothetical protein